MVASLEKQVTYKNGGYLLWVHRQHGICCLCRRLHGEEVPAVEAHHWGDKGMGQKCSDYEVARVCRKCHEYVQGKRRAYFTRTGEWEVLAAMQEDALDLLMAWSERGGKNVDG
jgi:hypothetical protein